MRASEHPASRPPGARPRPIETLEEARSDNQIPTDQGLSAEPLDRQFVDEGSAMIDGGQPTWELIDTAPQDGRAVVVQWTDEETSRRLVRWKQGRVFNGRRWVTGGHWAPSDNLQPLTADPPTHWLKPAGNEDEAGSLDEEDEPGAA